MPYYQHEGLNLYYEMVGTGDPVLCVHGATGAGEYEWAKVADALKEEYQFVIPDLRGHRNSDYRAGEMSIEAVDRDLIELISHEHLTPPHLVAFSFGAETALDLELTYPGTATSLILLSPGLGDPKSSVPTRAELEGGWPRTLRSLHAESHGEEHWLDIMLELCERSAARPKADLDAIAQIQCPVLLVLGSRDDPRRLRQAEIFREARDRTAIVIIEGGRHAVHKDNPAEVVSTIRTFLSRISEPASRPAVS